MLRAFVLCLAIGAYLPPTARAYEYIRDSLEMQSGQTGLACTTCHTSSAGGRGCATPPCLDAFGLDVRPARALDPTGFWSALVSVDSDGNGYPNHLELGDLDGDGRVDGPVLSDVGSDSGDLDECALGMATCPSGLYCGDLVACDPAMRPSYECTTEPSAPTGSPYVDEPWADARSARLGEWMEVDTLLELNPNVPTACGLSAPSAWFHFAGRCDGQLVVEKRAVDGTAVPTGLLGEYDLPPGVCTGTAPVERRCASGDAGLSLIRTSGSLLRVTGRFAGELRFVCAPASRGSCRSAPDPDDPSYEDLPAPGDAVACPALHPSCDYPATVGEGTHLVDAGGGPILCGADGATVLKHTATCDGVLEVSSSFSFFDGSLDQPGAGLEVRSAACPGGERLACDLQPSVDGRFDPWSRPSVTARVEVFSGQELFIYVRGSRQQQETVRIACTPEVSDGHCALCDPRATCQIDPGLGGSLDCTCPDSLVGDGVATSLGGSGCSFPGATPYCLEREPPLICHPDASCALASDGSPQCHCNEGYRGSGFDCVDENECADGTAGCGVNTACINYLGVPARCRCADGFAPREDGDGRLDCVPLCGDGEVGPGEECDDGNLLPDDGCSPRCDVELNYRCFRDQGLLSRCVNTCGDGWIDENEEYFCDRTLNLDDCGCSLPGAGREAPWGVFGLGLGVVWWRRRR